MIRYKIRKKWRHFKYGILRLFFGEQDLKRMIDIDRLDFEDSVKITAVTAKKWLTQEDREYFRLHKGIKYGLQYELARQMAEAIANHVVVSEIYDTDIEKYICVGEINLIEKR